MNLTSGFLTDFIFSQVIAALAYMVYFIDTYQQSWLRHIWGFDSEVTFYYMCGMIPNSPLDNIYKDAKGFIFILHEDVCFCSGALLFFALLGLSGCFITCYDRRVRNDLAQPCRELCLCCCQPGYNLNPHLFLFFIFFLFKKQNYLYFPVYNCSSVGHMIELRNR